MFSSAKPSFCSNFQTYKKKSFEKNINPFFFQLKNWPVHFPLDLHQIGFLCLQNRNQIGHKSFCKWQNILDDGYEFQIKRLLGLRNSKIKQKCLWNVKQHSQIAKISKKVQYRRLYYLGICFKCRNHSSKYYFSKDTQPHPFLCYKMIILRYHEIFSG